MSSSAAKQLRLGTPWRNWCGNERITPRHISTPSTTDEIRDLLSFARSEGRRVKPIGSGHSFTGAAIAPDIQLDLSEFQGIVDIDRQRKRVTLRAGTKLWQIPALRAGLGLAMQNLGDINRQSILGAVSTSTHGTGLGFGALSSQVVGLEILTATGDTLHIDESQPEMLDALRVSLGAYGVITEITLQLVDDFDLHVLEGVDRFSRVVDSWRELCETHDHFEFFWFGHADQVITKTSQRLEPRSLPRTPKGVGEFISDEVVGNGAFAALCQLGRFVPKSVPALNRFATSAWGSSDRVRHWSEGFASPRRVRFYETEYALPFDAVPEVLRDMQRMFARDGVAVTFPVEVRSAAADTAWLATNHGRETGYIAIHQHIDSDFRDYFQRVQRIFTTHDGRPHWGKMHTLDATSLAALYPRWDDAVALRQRLDPDGMFTNAYLEQVFGL